MLTSSRGDRLQGADGGEAMVEEVTPYHSTEVAYDLTINELHTYYVFAGDVPVLVHNCDEYRGRSIGRRQQHMQVYL